MGRALTFGLTNALRNNHDQNDPAGSFISHRDIGKGELSCNGSNGTQPLVALTGFAKYPDSSGGFGGKLQLLAFFSWSQ